MHHENKIKMLSAVNTTYVMGLTQNFRKTTRLFNITQLFNRTLLEGRLCAITRQGHAYKKVSGYLICMDAKTILSTQ